MWKALGYPTLVVSLVACSGRMSRTGEGGGAPLGGGSGTGGALGGGTAGAAGAVMHAGGSAAHAGGANNTGTGGNGAFSMATGGAFAAFAGAAGEHGGSVASGGGPATGAGGAMLVAGSTSGGASSAGDGGAGGSTPTDAGAGGEPGTGFPPRPLCGDVLVPANVSWCEGIGDMALAFEGLEDAGLDGKMSPGEEGSVIIRMHNAGSDTLESPCLGLFANHPGVTPLEVINPKLILFGLTGGASWTTKLRFRVEPSVAPGTRVHFMVWVDAHTAGCAEGGEVRFDVDVAD